jgi:hypothetical protein
MSNAGRKARTFRVLRTGVVARARRYGRPAQGDKQARLPESATENWKHRVEAEARKRLKREIRDVSAERR